MSVAGACAMLVAVAVGEMRVLGHTERNSGLVCDNFMRGDMMYVTVDKLLMYNMSGWGEGSTQMTPSWGNLDRSYVQMTINVDGTANAYATMLPWHFAFSDNDPVPKVVPNTESAELRPLGVWVENGTQYGLFNTDYSDADMELRDMTAGRQLARFACMSSTYVSYNSIFWGYQNGVAYIEHYAIDVRNPSAPRCNQFGEFDRGLVAWLVLDGEIGYVASEPIVYVLNFSNPMAPTQLATLKLHEGAIPARNGYRPAMWGPMGVDSKKRLYAAPAPLPPSNEWTVYAIDVSNPLQPHVVESLVYPETENRLTGRLFLKENGERTYALLPMADSGKVWYLQLN